MKEKEILFRTRIKRIHFIGIGGIGMSGIAEILLDLGYEVTGSDLRRNDNIERLLKKGCRVKIGHSPGAVEGSDVVVYSSAIRKDNVEIIKAVDMDIPVIPRAEMLAELMRFKDGIAVAGTHGKTTTTSLASTLLHQGGLDPTVVIGGKLNSLGSNARSGTGNLMLVEADESDRSFLYLRPLINIVTNIDREHMNSYKDMDDLKNSFMKFMSSIPFYGFNIVCIDNEMLREVTEDVHRQIITYGFANHAHYRISDLKTENGLNKFRISTREGELGVVATKMFGRHNALNCTAVVALGTELGMEFSQIQKALLEFGGVDRRFTIKGVIGSVTVVDDYGHHPTEISATLSAARQAYPDKKITAVFQPHRYSRVSSLFKDFAKAFYVADQLIVTEIYAAGEYPINGITGKKLAEAAGNYGHPNSIYGGNLDEVLELVVANAGENEIILTLGAGTITHLSKKIVERLEAS
ncbi:MAG: UDP-N-acetylmuramate--L-alanine ligase [Deltaproteobacteria bacterium]|jgi:UDP-N-acetylmuramate--alanine ligase|nr:UDP-N-acetylmuramate--L-alanine ligase [Deltaproteobacteria bacterium]